MSGNIFNFANGNKVLRLGFPHRHLIENGFMDNIIEEVTGSEYKYGFVTNVETDTIAKGLRSGYCILCSPETEGGEGLEGCGSGTEEDV